MQDGFSKPVELIDQDLDEVAGGDFNIADIDVRQFISQEVEHSWDVDQTAANVSSVTVYQNN